MSQCLLSQIVEALGEPSPEEIIKYNYSGGVFNECRNLISVTFEEGSNLEKIPDYTFYMSDVKYIVVPDRLNKIGGSLAFSPCSNNNQSYDFRYNCADSYPCFRSWVNCNRYTYEYDNTKLTLIGKTGSIAETYAQNNGQKFIDSSEYTPVKNTSTIKSKRCYMNEDITVFLSAENGVAPYTYSVRYKNQYDDDFTKAEVTSATECSFRGEKSGSYKVVVTVTDSKGIPSEKTFNVSCTSKNEIIRGDVDGDGEMTINDATKIQFYLAQLKSLDETQIKAADVNNDGDVNITDVTKIQLILAFLDE